MKPLRTTPMLLAALVAACATSRPESAGFRHLESDADGIVTRHAIALRITAPPGFRTTPAAHRTAIFDGHPYEVSLAALLGNGEAVMVHAERVADGSGASDYDDLPRAGWPDARFGRREMCATIDRAAVESEHDLGFLDVNGWNPEGALALEQYLASTPDHNQEVVVSLVARVPDCADPARVRAVLQELRGRVVVGPA